MAPLLTRKLRAGTRVRPRPLSMQALRISTSDEACRRDGDRLAQLRASPSGEEPATFRKRAGLRGLAAAASASDGRVWAWSRPMPPSAANSTASSDSVLAQVCASERAALDRLRKEPSAEAARLFSSATSNARACALRCACSWINASTPRHGHWSSAAEPGADNPAGGRYHRRADRQRTDSVAYCRRETPELHRIRATLDLGDANRFRQRGDLRRSQAPGGATTGEPERMRGSGSRQTPHELRPVLFAHRQQRRNKGSSLEFLSSLVEGFVT